MASSCCTSTKTIWGGCGEHLSRATQALCTAAVPLSLKHVLAYHRLSPEVAIASEDVRSHCCGVLVRARARASTFVCVCGKAGLTPRLFLAWYTEFCLCVMLLCSWDRRPGHPQQQSTGITPAPYCSLTSAPPAPTSVGETYKIPGRHLGEAICKKRGSLLTDAMFIHRFLSPVTNGLIIQLSPWNVISHFFMGRIPIPGTSPPQSEPWKRYALDSQSRFTS